MAGAIPAGLNGTWVRNGPNPQSGESVHWYGGGMLHGLRLADGRAEWYGRRYIKTPYVGKAISARYPPPAKLVECQASEN